LPMGKQAARQDLTLSDERIGHADVTLERVPLKLNRSSTVMRGLDPRIHLLAKEDGLHRTSGLPEVRTSTECRKPGIPGLRVKPRQ
jgi:hypothetical protein